MSLFGKCPPEIGVLRMTASSNVWLANGLFGNGHVCVECLWDVVAAHDQHRGLMSGSRNTETTGFEIESRRVNHTREGMHHDHELSLETLPSFWGVHPDTVSSLSESLRQR